MTLADAAGAPRPSMDMPYRRIATEEAFAPPEVIEHYRRIFAGADPDPGAKGLSCALPASTSTSGTPSSRGPNRLRRWSPT